MNEVFFSNNTYLSVVVDDVGGFVLSIICFLKFIFFGSFG